MIEPTETESKETLDSFINIMIKAAKTTEENPDVILSSPLKTNISRPDETKAARELKVTYNE